MRATCRELSARAPKTYVRGKYETWFLVEFVKRAVVHLKEAAGALGGRVDGTINLERSNAVMLLASLAALPESLDLFLQQFAR